MNLVDAGKDSDIAIFALVTNAAWMGCLEQAIVESARYLVRLQNAQLIFDYVAASNFIDDTSVIQFLLQYTSDEQLQSVAEWWKWAMLCTAAQQSQLERIEKLVASFEDNEQQWLQ